MYQLLSDVWSEGEEERASDPSFSSFNGAEKPSHDTAHCNFRVYKIQNDFAIFLSYIERRRRPLYSQQMEST